MEENKTLAQWVACFSNLDLPLLKQSRTDLQQIGPYESVSMAKFSNIALTDPGLTLKILRTASAMPRSRLQDEIHTVDTAAIKLGSSLMTATVASMQLLEKCLDQHDKNLYMQIIARAYHAAYQAYGMARERVDMAPEELFTAAMLQDIGTLMLLVHGAGILANCNTLDDLDNQEATLGFSLRELSYELAKTWKLSSFILKSLESFDEAQPGNPRIYEIHLASELARCADQGWETDAMAAIIDKIAHHLHCDPELALLEVRDNAIQCAEETIFYGVIPAAASLPDLDDGQRKRFIEHIPADSKQLLRNKIQPPAASLAPEQPFSPLNTEVFDQVIKAIKILLSGEFNLAEFMKLVKRGFQAGLKFNRAFFAMPETQGDQACLVSRFMFGNETGLQDLRIPVTGRNLFQRLLDSPQAVHCKASNCEAVLALLPDNFKDVIQTDEFFVMTIRTSRKTLGIVYADRHGNDYGLDARDYEKFRQLCQLLAKGFERLGK